MKKKITTAKQAQEFLYNSLPVFHRQGAAAYKKDIGNIRLLMEKVGNPHQNFKSIHVAGTNGKGSTSHFIAAILQKHGFRIGMYTSPHYLQIRERIKINGTFVPEEQFITLLNRFIPYFEEIKPSFFEIMCAMAFLYFSESKVDYAVIETGMGGRLDSTNIITPEVSVITNISYDHTQFLGNSLEEIAGEKAGIIKSNIPVIIGQSSKITDSIFIEKAKSCNSSYFFVPNFVKIVKNEEYNQFQYYSDFLKSTQEFNFILNSYPDFQLQNLATALYSTQMILTKNNILINQLLTQQAVNQIHTLTYFIGRYQLLSQNPLIIADSAHNEDGISVLFAQIKKETFQKLWIIIGFVADKNIEKIISILPKNAKYIFTQAPIERALEAQTLYSMAHNHLLKGEVIKDPISAYIETKGQIDKDDCLLIMGSIFVVGEILKLQT